MFVKSFQHVNSKILFKTQKNIYITSFIIESSSDGNFQRTFFLLEILNRMSLLKNKENSNKNSIPKHYDHP